MSGDRRTEDMIKQDKEYERELQETIGKYRRDSAVWDIWDARKRISQVMPLRSVLGPDKRNAMKQVGEHNHKTTGIIKNQIGPEYRIAGESMADRKRKWGHVAKPIAPPKQKKGNQA